MSEEIQFIECTNHDLSDVCMGDADVAIPKTEDPLDVTHTSKMMVVEYETLGLDDSNIKSTKFVRSSKHEKFFIWALDVFRGNRISKYDLVSKYEMGTYFTEHAETATRHGNAKEVAEGEVG